MPNIKGDKIEDKIKLKKVVVQVVERDELTTFKLNSDDDLSKIRVKLEKEINMNALLFAEKIRTEPENQQSIFNNTSVGNISIVNINNASIRFSKIPRNEENKYSLNEIIETTDENRTILYLIKGSTFDWQSFNSSRKLDYGCTINNNEIERVEKRAFLMVNCKLDPVEDSCREEEVRCNSEEDWLTQKNLYVSANVKIQEFAKLGLSSGTLKQEKSQCEIDSFYKFTEHRKLSLKFKNYLEPTEEFLTAVKKAIYSENPQKEFKQIVKDYGKFIPTEIILGGRVHYEDYHSKITKNRSENSKGFVDIKGVQEAEVKKNYKNEEGKSNNYSRKYKKVIGGKSCGFKNFDEDAWAKTLEDDKNWHYIGLLNFVSIFTLLPEDLRERIFRLVGKKILYTNIRDHKYSLRENEPEAIKLTTIFPDISEILQNKDADCNIFTTVAESENKKDTFTCQIYHPNYPIVDDPQLIIHCIQPEFKVRHCKLKIRIMIIGYDTDLNSDLSAQPKLEVLERKFTSPNGRISETKFECSSLNFSCIGIPVLYGPLNPSLIIGHHFFKVEKVEKRNKIGARVFSYCLNKKRHVDLPDFIFTTLIVSGYPDKPSAFGTKSLKELISSERTSNFNPKYISLYFTSDKKYKPSFLRRNINRIRIKTPTCDSCDCSICKTETWWSGWRVNTKVTGKNFRCLFFDP